jgi:hypothetical protein
VLLSFHDTLKLVWVIFFISRPPGGGNGPVSKKQQKVSLIYSFKEMK